MYEGAALSFGLIRACRSGLVLYCSVLSDAGGENDGSSAIFERSLLMNYCSFNIEPHYSDMCVDHRCPQTLVEICRNVGICYSFRAVAAREKYPGFVSLHRATCNVFFITQSVFHDHSKILTILTLHIIIHYYGILWLNSCEDLFHTYLQVTLDISGSPMEIQWGSRKYPG